MSPLLKMKNGTDEKYLLRKYCFLAAVYAFAVMTVFYIIHSNTLVFGEKTVLRMDLYHQYGPLYAEVYDRITGGNSLVYSWTSGLGGSFLGNFFNYCCSPFVLFMLICGHKNMPEAIALMIMFKAIFAAVSFTYYINKSNKSVRKESIAFGLLYAFSAYFVAYSWNIMWMDAMAIFPLVILGIEYIIQKNKPSLYIFAMTYTMITNYYMAYMVCILSVLYFLFFYFGRYELSSLLRVGHKKEAEEEVLQPDMPAVISEPETPAAEEISEPVTEEIPADENIQYTEKAGETLTENIEAPAVEGKKGKKKKAKKPEEQRLKNKRFWVTGWTFALASFLCFMLAAFALLPISNCLASSSATNGTFPEKTKIYFDVFNFIANHLPSVETTIRSSGDNVIPNVYCGLITVLLLPLFFFSDRIPGKQKVSAAILLIALYCGFALNMFNFIWHGLHMPNDLPYRFSFGYSFILLILAYKAYLNIDEFPKKTFVGIGFAMLAFAVLADKFDVPNCKELTVLLTVIFTILYVVIFGMLKSPNYKRDAIIGLLFFTMILEVTVADAPKLVMAQGKDAYVSDYQDFKDIQKETEEGDTELFYRTELAKLRARMDPCWYGYNGVSTFSSMAYEHVAKVMEDMGLFGNNINSYTYYPQTPIFNSVFSLRYIYDNEDFINSEDFYEAVSSNDDFDSYRYKYFLPVAFSVNNDLNEWDRTSNNPFDVQNEFMKSATGVEDILIPVEATDFDATNIDNVSLSTINSGTTFTVTKTNKGEEGKAIVKVLIDEPGEYYIYTGSTNISGLSIEAEDFSYNYLSSAIQPLTMDLGYLPADSEIVVTCTVPKNDNSAKITFCAAKIDKDRFVEAYDKIVDNGTIELSEFNETSMKGTIEVNNADSLLFTSIPYDASWRVYVDGTELSHPKTDDEGKLIDNSGDILTIGGALIGFELEEGSHEIEFRYKAKGLSDGILLTVLGIGIIALIFVYNKWLYKWFEKKNRIPIVFRKPDNSKD